MKWGKNKAAASRPFLISHVLPSSWLTKFKQMGMGTSGQQRHATRTKSNPKGRSSSRSGSKLNLDSALPFSSPNLKTERFYGGDDDAYWRLSFGDECQAYGDRKKYVSDEDDDDDDDTFPPSSCRSCCARSNRVGAKTGEGDEEVENFTFLPAASKKETAVEIRTPRLGSVSVERESKKKVARRLNSKRQLGSEEEVYEAKRKQGKVEAERVEFSKRPAVSESEGAAWNSATKAGNFDLAVENEIFLSSAEWGKLKETRKSVHISGEPMQKRKQSKPPAATGKARVLLHSPRTPTKSETCKIRAIEEMKMRAKRKAKPPEKTVAAVGEGEGFDCLKSFAVVKSSYDPQKDFRESMVEMIEEMGIRKAEELEELLACYLTLNSDEYHELIIKVFRQVWFDLNRAAAAAAYDGRES